MDAEKIGGIMVDGYGVFYRNTPNATLSAVRADEIDGFTAALDSWVDAVMADQASFKAATSLAMLNEVSRMVDMDTSRDLVHYVTLVNKEPSVSQDVKAAGDKLVEFINSRLLIKKFSTVDDNYGLSIYIPDLTYDSATYETLGFSSSSKWGEFVNAMMRERLNGR